jgi:hypothetical protein
MRIRSIRVVLAASMALLSTLLNIVIARAGDTAGPFP